MSGARTAGWALMANARKWHFFGPDGRSHCGRWAFFGAVQPCISVNADACARCRAAIRGDAARRGLETHDRNVETEKAGAR